HVRLAELEDLGIQLDRLQQRVRKSRGKQPVKTRAAEADHQDALRLRLDEERAIQRSRVVHHQLQRIAEINGRLQCLAASRARPQLDDVPTLFDRETVVEGVVVLDEVSVSG